MTQKYVFLDIDGTLVGYDAQIPASALEALKRAQQNGHKIIIASGRSLSSICPQLFEALDFDGIICSGGAQVICNGQTVFESLWSDAEKRIVADYMHRESAHFIVMNRHHVFVEPNFWSETAPRLREAGVDDEILQGAYGDAVVTAHIEEQAEIQKLLYFFAKQTPPQISRELNDQFEVTDFSIGKADETILLGEITQAGVNKGSAILRYLEHVGAKIEDSIAFGDSGNDMEMIKTVAVGVAMGNATDAIKSEADWITTDVDADGIRNGFLHFGLI